MAIALGLMAALVYGGADFLGGLASKRTPAFTVVLLSQLCGFVVLLAALPLVGVGEPLPRDLATGAAAGLFGGGGVALLYRSLAVGTMSVIAPITAVGASALPVMFGLLTGERPGPIALLGVGVAVVAVVLVSATPGGADTPAASSRRLSPGIPQAVASGLAFGVFFILLDATSADAGLWPLVGARSSILVVAVIALATRTSLRPNPGSMGRIVGSGVLDMAANVLYVLATRQGLLSVVAVLVSLYPATTVLLARVVLGERLHRMQIAGLGAVAMGVALIALG
jgi:drug/metabolite transporter (DMT)-like permease